VAIRQEVKKGVALTYNDKNTGEARPSLKITQYSVTAEGLSPVPDAVDHSMRVGGMSNFTASPPQSPDDVPF